MKKSLSFAALVVALAAGGCTNSLLRLDPATPPKMGFTVPPAPTQPELMKYGLTGLGAVFVSLGYRWIDHRFPTKKK